MGILLGATIPPVAKQGGGPVRTQHLAGRLLPAPRDYAHDFCCPSCGRALLVGVDGALMLCFRALREPASLRPAPGAELPAAAAALRAHEVGAVEPAQVYVACLAWQPLYLRVADPPGHY